MANRRNVISHLDDYQIIALARTKHIVVDNLILLKLKLKRTVKSFLVNQNKLHYPKTLQYPITNKCNLNCVMCNIHANPHNEIPLPILKEVLNNKVFSKIESVGINGGEPFLLKDLVSYIEVVVNALPKLENVYIISNGTFTDLVVHKLPIIKGICNKKNVKLTVSFSIDGYGEVHDRIRGKKGTFDKLVETIDIILKNPSLYCDHLNFICTISSQNVYELDLLESFAKEKGIELNYNIATDHERLKNDCKKEQYSLFENQHAKMLAQEFLYRKFRETGNTKYYSLFYYLYSKEHKRIDDCSNLKDAITLTANGDICYCATHSKVLGNILDDPNNIKDLYFGNEAYNNTIKEKYCNNCSHYIYGVNVDNYHLYLEEINRTRHVVKL